MTKNIMRLAIIGLLIISLLGCSDRPSAGSSDIKEMFPADISVTDVNDSLQVKVEGDQKSLPVDSKVSLLIYNESSHFLFFSGENYVRLLIFREGEWIEVTNELTYSGSKTLSPKGTILLDQTSTWAKPQIAEQALTPDQNVLPLRIVVIGEILENEVRTGQFVGAYVDVDINR